MPKGKIGDLVSFLKFEISNNTIINWKGTPEK